MALSANALVSLAETKGFLNITGTGSDVRLEDVINSASATWELECNRPFKKTAYTDLRLSGPAGPRLYLPAAPIDITAAVTILVDEVAQTVWKQETDGDPDLKDVIVASTTPMGPLGIRDHLYRSGGWRDSSRHPYNVRLSYTGGFIVVPDDLKRAVLYTIQKLFRDEQKQLSDVQTVTLPSGSITLFDITLPRWALRVMDKYRWGQVG